jgi:hypothetical protein
MEDEETAASRLKQPVQEAKSPASSGGEAVSTASRLLAAKKKAQQREKP